MSTNLIEIEKHLKSLYVNTPINAKAVIDIAEYVFTDEATRFEVLTTIDSVLKQVDINATIDVITDVKVLRVDKVGFGVKFITGQKQTGSKPNTESKINGLLDLLKSVSANDPNISFAGPFPLPHGLDVGEQDETEDFVSVEEQLQIVTTAIDWVRQIEQHQLTITNANPVNQFKSALNKYIPAIEANFLKPYLPTNEETK
jgi:hypothetical protein